MTHYTFVHCFFFISSVNKLFSQIIFFADKFDKLQIEHLDINLFTHAINLASDRTPTLPQKEIFYR